MAEERLDIVDSQSYEQEIYGHVPENIKDKLQWFQDQKIGVIFHWGLYAEAGIVESWQLSEEDEWARDTPWRDSVKTIREDYWALNKVFNPMNFNPDYWAETCRDAGFKYVIFTTKHHDGFNMYDTQFSDYKITGEESPFHQHPKADIFGEVMSAFRKVGLGTGAYYSKPDWHSPYYWVPGQHAKGRLASYQPSENPKMWSQFENFVSNQLQEICTNYGNIDILWLDGGWVNGGKEQLNMPEIVAELRANQPDLLVVDRMIGGEFENYVTPERKIPDEAPKKVWESNLPLANNWGYVPNDHYKSSEEIIESVIKIISMGGNVILGVGPKPDGSLPGEALERLSVLGEFLKQYGEGIYKSYPSTDIEIDGWYLTETDEAIYCFQLNQRNKVSHLPLSYFESEQIKEVYDMTNNQVLTIIDQQVKLPIHDGLVTVVKLVKDNQGGN